MGRFFGWRALLVVALPPFLWCLVCRRRWLMTFTGLLLRNSGEPVKIGDPYTCAVQMLNVVDTAHDTLRVTGLSDVVHSAGGNVATGDILSSTGLVFNGAVFVLVGRGRGRQRSVYRRDFVFAAVRDVDHDEVVLALHGAAG